MTLVTNILDKSFILILGKTTQTDVFDLIHIYKSGDMWIVADNNGNKNT